MDSKNIREGMKVKITKNIELTTKNLGCNHDMETMSKNNKTYIIENVIIDSHYGKIARVNHANWMPEDLIHAVDGWKEPVSVKGAKQTFDPCEL